MQVLPILSHFKKEPVVVTQSGYLAILGEGVVLNGGICPRQICKCQKKLVQFLLPQQFLQNQRLGRIQNMGRPFPGTDLPFSDCSNLEGRIEAVKMSHSQSCSSNPFPLVSISQKKIF